MTLGSHTIGWVFTFLLCFTLFNGTWGDCGFPERISNAEPKQGALDQTTFPPNATVSYDCRPGYTRVPGRKNSITCLENGSWSTPEAFCQLRSCGNPGEVVNGELEATDFLFGSKVKYTCNEGFRLSNKRNVRECLADGTWSNVLPQCDAVLCAAPELPANGEYHPQKDEYTYLDSVTFSCQKPLEVVGNPSISCTGTGEWSSNSPTCKAVNCANPDVTNSRRLSGFTGPYTLNSAISFACDKGFILRGSGSISCNIDSQWVPAIPQCERESTAKPVLCAAPELPANGEYHPQKDEYTYLDSVTFSCQKPLEVAGNPSISCTGTGEWSSNSPTCKAVNCPNPDVTNSRRLSGFTGPYTLNSVISFACDKGFILRGSGSISCNIDSQWVPAIPQCERESTAKPVNCPNPEVKNSRRLSGFFGPYTLNSSISFECDEGFILRGSGSISCNTDSQWIPEIPQCERESTGKPVNCPDPHVKNARRQSGFTGPYTLDSVILFECDEGFELKGSSSVKCNIDSEWVPALPQCERESTGKRCLRFDP